MATNCDRNLSVEQINQMALAQVWPNATSDFDPRAFTKEPVKAYQASAIKFDSNKLDWSLVPFEALEEMVQVLEFGAKKYDRWNWAQSGGFKWTRILSSTMRHLFAFARGEDSDPESGLSHISHAQCNLLFLAYYIRNKNTMNNDDRNVR